MFESFALPIGLWELIRRTVKEFIADDCLGLAAQLSYYFFLALFPALLFLLGWASFFSLSGISDQVVVSLGSFMPAEVLAILQDQIRVISNADHGGILTIGFAGALWSSSAAITSIVGSLNRAYDIDEGRPWWKVRLIAIGLTLGLALLVMVSFTLVMAGPTLAETLASRLSLGSVFEWSWKIVQWPLIVALISMAIGLVYYFGPDAEQEWEWITPGALLATILWLAISLAFKFYVTQFADYNAAYGTIGGVIMFLLWFYISGLALLAGAELNAEIEHASPYGKEPGEKKPGERKKIGRLAARLYKEREERRAVRPIRMRSLPGGRANSGALRDG